MENIKEKLKNTRELCYDLPDDMYYFTDFISEKVNDNESPLSMFLFLIAINNGKFIDEIPIEKLYFIINNISILFQVINRISSDSYKKEFMNICNKYDIKIPMYININEEYTRNILIAANYWTNIAQPDSLALSNTSTQRLYKMLSNRRPELTIEQLKKYKSSLAKIINEKYSIENYVKIDPKILCSELNYATNSIDVPYDTYTLNGDIMELTSDELRIYKRDENKMLILWKDSLSNKPPRKNI